ncbi:hypothetical protein EV702DRAFT_1048909 [Suillus placidus]|uniref:Uncharacterized protein n=1 Tax=Suillus placidus TaxID=48579 RepID=A0A9P6ZMU7_9AGAM|nr:hypothetical protein EV702DRAFT_1048909 [Suillus placidus]
MPDPSDGQCVHESDIEGADNTISGSHDGVEYGSIDDVMSIGGDLWIHDQTQIQASGVPRVSRPFSAFGHSLEAEASSLPIINDEPWQPFMCHADFEFAELAHQVALNNDQTNKMLQLIWQFEKHVISIPYKKEELEFDVHTWPLWDWAMDLLQDPSLASHFVWDAQHLYKHDGTDFKQFIHEPWTADHWWRIQSSLLNNGVPFALILYADKTHLTSSGHVKAFLVIANLPVYIRNGDGIGGGHMVGWLPIVPTDLNEDGKLSYQISNMLSGTRLSSSYEEQCVMALVHGLNSKCPCPICLVPSTKLSDLSMTYPTRNVEDAKAFLELYLRDRVAGEAVLKAHGLRPIAVCVLIAFMI